MNGARRKTWLVIWLVVVATLALIVWGEWLEVRRRRYADERFEQLKEMNDQLLKNARDRR